MITWPLSSKKSSGTFLHCHDLSRNQRVAFQWHWSALPAPVGASLLPGPLDLCMPSLCKWCLTTSSSSAVVGLLNCGWALASLSRLARPGNVSVFLLGNRQAEGHSGYLSTVSSVVCEGFFHNLTMCLFMQCRWNNTTTALSSANTEILCFCDWFWDYILRKMSANWKPRERLTRMIRSFKHTALEEMGKIQTVVPSIICLDNCCCYKGHVWQIGPEVNNANSKK